MYFLCVKSALVRLTIAAEPESDSKTGLRGPGALNIEAAVNALEVCWSIRRWVVETGVVFRAHFTAPTCVVLNINDVCVHK